MLSMCRLFAGDNSLQHASYNISDIELNLNHDLQMVKQIASQI